MSLRTSMRLRWHGALALAALLALALTAGAAEPDFHFGVIGHSFKSGPDAGRLKQAIRETNLARPAFVVVNGIKANAESCSDKLYGQRKSVLAASERPLILSLAASDWSDCKNSLGKSTAIDRLNRLREVFFADDMSQGEHKIALTRLSASASFRSYAENAQWEHGGILFATINLPANNNHFRPEAGRNSEFEDRIVANRSWLKRLFATAERRKIAGLVLFSDGNPGVLAEQKKLSAINTKQDGFAETRRQIRALAKKFSGQVLLIDTETDARPGNTGITWQDNIGHLSVTSNWVDIRVHVAAGGPAAGAPAAGAPAAGARVAGKPSLIFALKPRSD
jgi:hypothetical protein